MTETPILNLVNGIAQTTGAITLDSGMAQRLIAEVQVLRVQQLIPISAPTEVSISDATSLKETIAEALGDQLSGALDCDRCWSAWSVGTMTEDDFHAVEDRLDEIQDAVLKAVMSSPQIRRAIFMQEAIDNLPSLQQRLGPDDIKPFINWYRDFILPHRDLPKLPKGEEA